MSTKDTAAGFGVGVLLGLALGVAVGLLLAPRPGYEIRGMLRTKADDIALMAHDVTVNHGKVYKDVWEGRGEHVRVLSE